LKTFAIVVCSYHFNFSFVARSPPLFLYLIAYSLLLHTIINQKLDGDKGLKRRLSFQVILLIIAWCSWPCTQTSVIISHNRICFQILTFCGKDTHTHTHTAKKKFKLVIQKYHMLTKRKKGKNLNKTVTLVHGVI